MALDDLSRDVTATELRQAVHDLSGRYRGTSGFSSLFGSRVDTLAYAVYRLPATFAAAAAALSAVRSVVPHWQPNSLLDVGAGPGTASWAAIETWPTIHAVELIEGNEHMATLGQRLAANASDSALSGARWTRGDLAEVLPETPRDLVVVSYVLSELPEEERPLLLERLWRATSGVLVVIEPGTPGGFGTMLDARSRLIASGAAVLAPCPHSSLCPMATDDWCHFSQRLPRARTHREAKHATVGYEDEKYSYAALTRLAVEPVQSRVVRHPQVRAGHIYLELCTREGLQQQIVTKKDKARFREARRTAWGSAFPA